MANVKISINEGSYLKYVKIGLFYFDRLFLKGAFKEA